MKSELRGILSAILTPFNDSDGRLDEGAYKALVRSQVSAGIHGIVAGGSTGEHPALSVAERQRLFALATSSPMSGQTMSAMRWSWPAPPGIWASIRCWSLPPISSA